MSKALVLAGGGVAGVAWEVGVIMGLYDGGVYLRDADLVVGTSAGSSVAAQITSGTPLEQLYAVQMMDPAQSGEIAVDFDPQALQDAFREIFLTTPPDPKLIRARVGAYALAATTIPEHERRAVIAGRLPVHDWPRTRLHIPAVDAESGDVVIFNNDSGVGLVDAVSASCAVPGVWPTVTIEGRRYTDGGVRSPSNADLATGYSRVLIITPAPLTADNPMLAGFQREIEALENSGSQVFTISASAEALAAMGRNVLDPSTRPPSAQAGRAQGHEAAPAVAAFWNSSRAE